MDWQRRSLRVGAAAIALAVAVRLCSTGAFQALTRMADNEALVSLMIYLETGRIVKAAPLEEPESSQTTEPPVQPPLPVTFTEADAELVYIRGTSDKAVDIPTMLETPLSWDLTGEEPTVLILHTHATECYTKTADDTYEESADYRTLNCGYNMTAVGARVAELLEAAGIGVVHATDLHDYPSYNGSYGNSRATAQQYLEQYPSIRLVLDIHRDAAVNSDGTQFATSATVDGRRSAQLMLLMSGGHPDWGENMSLAVKLTAQLEKMYPGLTRGIITRNGLYNQDLCPGALLVEVGSAGNTLDEAMTAAQCLAQAIIALADGTE